MKRIRINNDIRIKVSVSRNGLPENFGNLIEDGLILLFRHLSYSNIQITPASYTINSGTIDMVITADQVLYPGKYIFLIQYKQVNVLNPDGYDTITWDSEAFEIVNSTSQVGGTDPVVTYAVDLYAEIGIGLKGTDGANAYELWISEPTNADKTIDDYYVWLREPAVTAANATIAAKEASDQAEAARVSAESSRVNAENARKAAETARVNEEAARAEAEQARATAAQAQAEAEALRVNAETARVNAENARKAAETARVNAENARKAAETARVNAETARVNAETARVNAETARVNAESARVSAEQLRVAAEQARVTAETAREQYIAGIRAEFSYYRALDTVFSLNSNMELIAEVPDGSTDEYSIDSSGQLIITY